MRARIFPPVSSSLARSVSSYVQVNIYGTNLKKLRAQGVDIKHILQFVGCRCIIMDVPVFSNEFKKSGGCGGKLLNKAIGTSALGDQSSCPDEMDPYSESTSATVTARTAHVIPSEKPCGNELLEEILAEEFMDCQSGFNTTVISEEHIGPLTSTPLAFKDVNFRTSVIIDDSYLCPGNDLEEAISKNTRNSIGIAEFCQEESVNARNETSEYHINEAGLTESSFVAFRSAVMEGMRADDDSKCLFADIATKYGDPEKLPKPNMCPPQNDSHLEIYQSDKQFSALPEGVGETDAAFEPQKKVAVHKNPFRAKKAKLSIPQMKLTRKLSSCEEVLESSSETEEDTMRDEHSSCTAKQIDLGRPHCERIKETASELLRNCIQRPTAKPESPKSSRSIQKRQHAGISKNQQNFIGDVADEQSNQVANQERTIRRKSTSRAKYKGDEIVFRCHIPLCEKELLWRRRYGKNRLVDHVRTHWGKAVKQCKLCDFKASNFRKVHNHHSMVHSDQPYSGALSNETKEDLDELLELWKRCFPDLNWPLQDVQKCGKQRIDLRSRREQVS
ncbi:hypothetical protein RB195_005144 [Necator americanus]|uniref:C2H2-type domain-containing protein n=1 Tax=Necator americanus TaxID=51031 RepID=A0ABR1BPM5_NECAM